MSVRVSIVIPSHNALAGLQLAVGSILQTTGDEVEILGFDNGSSDDTCKYLVDVENVDPRVRPLSIGQYIGQIRAKNVGVVEAKGDLILVLDPIWEMRAGWLEPFIQAFDQNVALGQLGLAGNPSILAGDGAGVTGGWVEYIDGSFAMTRTALARRFVLADPWFEMFFCDDSDYSLRLRAFGQRIDVMHSTAIVRRSYTIPPVPIDLMAHWHQNRERFQQRWRHYLACRDFNTTWRPDEYPAETPKIRERAFDYFVDAEGNRPGRGLDVGCRHDKVIPEALGLDFEWYPGQVEMVRDAERTPYPFPDGHFDWVFSSHLLEHMWRPWDILTEWCRLVRPGGHVVLYLPHGDHYRNEWNADHKLELRPPEVIGHLVGQGFQIREHFDDVVPPVEATGRYSFFVAARKTGAAESPPAPALAAPPPMETPPAAQEASEPAPPTRRSPRPPKPRPGRPRLRPEA